MDPKDVRRLVDEVVAQLEERKERRRRVSPVGAGLAIGLASVAFVGCAVDEYGAPIDDTLASDQVSDAEDADDETTTPVDLYGVPADAASGDDVADTDVGGPVDLYGIMMDATDAADSVDGELPPPVDLYGIPSDAG